MPPLFNCVFRPCSLAGPFSFPGRSKQEVRMDQNNGSSPAGVGGPPRTELREHHAQLVEHLAQLLVRSRRIRSAPPREDAPPPPQRGGGSNASG